MKKNITAAGAFLLAAVMLTSCGNSDNTAETTASETTAAETSASDTVTEQTEESPSASESTEAEEIPAETEAENNANPLAELADAVLSVSEWPSMMEIDDEFMLKDYFLIEKNDPNYKNLIVMQCPMSANMSELIIIEADDTSAAEEDLKARREKAQQTDAFYPEDQDKADNAIVGVSGNYAYYFLCSEPEKAEEALLMKIGE